MNRNSKGIKQNKERDFRKMMNACKNSEYSGIYTVASFVITIVLVMIGEIWDLFSLPSSFDDIRILVELSFIVMMFLFTNFKTKKAKKNIESKKFFEKETEHSRIVKIAENIGYISPLVCVLTWVLTWVSEPEWKIFYSGLIMILIFIVTLVKPVEK